ncbi:hypothetical protein ACHQM5_023406 [Ranunculus cassubicifolius]
MNFTLQIHTFSLLLFISLTQSFNISNIFISSYAINTESPSPLSNLLKDVLEEIVMEQKWKLDEIRVSKVRKLRFANLKKYEFRVRNGKSSLLFRFSDEKIMWKRVGKKKKLRDLVSEIRVLKKVRLDGPFELRVYGDDQMKLTLPLNTTHSGLKRLVVGEGITVIVEGAREISLTHSSDFDLPITNKSLVMNKKRNPYFPIRPLSCTPLPPVQIIGSASLRAFNTRNPNVHIETSFLSPEMIELLPVKIYKETFIRRQTCPITALNKKLDLLQKLMKIMPDERISEWRTKPVEGRIFYDVVARMEGERLMPIVVKKVRRFITADSMALSTLMSNISFTKFPSVVGPPETLTLDVKW